MMYTGLDSILALGCVFSIKQQKTPPVEQAGRAERGSRGSRRLAPSHGRTSFSTFHVPGTSGPGRVFWRGACVACVSVSTEDACGVGRLHQLGEERTGALVVHDVCGLMSRYVHRKVGAALRSRLGVEPASTLGRALLLDLRWAACSALGHLYRAGSRVSDSAAF